MPTLSPTETVRVLHAGELPCPVCGYSMVGLKAPRCPECDADVRIIIEADGPRATGFRAVGRVVGRSVRKVSFEPPAMRIAVPLLALAIFAHTCISLAVWLLS